ncbi:MAG: ATPase, T2SS/T4P/T4SS family [bacterium]|nr:ATPase, T2SS/T4P/T4SS family [bacterium]
MVEMEVRKVTKGVESNMVAFDFERTPITQIADYIIITASNNGTSDIHFDPRDDNMMVRFRIDGDLQDYTCIPKLYERTLTTRLKLLASMNITESRLPQDGAIKGEFGGKYLDMRVSCLPLNTGEKIVIRILDYTRSLQGIDNLGFNQTNLKKIKRMMGVPNGIILVTGATGSGKSTTVYSILQELNKPEVNIITVEDPIEMNIEGMNQVQVNSEIGMTFAAALRSILRQDPNVILIGEIRDSETAQIAVRASITGHLVLSTIHTNNALATIERLLDMDVERYLLSTSLTGIIAQRLAKQLCTSCRIERETTKYEKKVFKKFMHRDVDKIYDANPKGCENCRKGYKGRIAIHEVLEFDDEIRSAVSNPKLTKEELSEMVYNEKTISMLQDALGKAISGLTSFEEVYRVIEIETDPDDDTAYLTRAIEDDEEEEDTKKETVQTNSLDDVATKSANQVSTNQTNLQNLPRFNINGTEITDIKNIKATNIKPVEAGQTQTTQQPSVQAPQVKTPNQAPAPAPTQVPAQPQQPVPQNKPAVLPQVATLTKEQQLANAQMEKAKKEQAAALAKQQSIVEKPIMLTQAQAEAQAKMAKEKLNAITEKENEKKLAEVLAKPQKVTSQKLVVANPNLNPTIVTAGEKKQMPAQTTPPQQQPSNLYQLPKSTTQQQQPKIAPPKIEKIEKAIPELNISIQAAKEQTLLPTQTKADSPLTEEDNTFNEKDKVQEIDINKISKSQDLKKEENLANNPLKPTIKPEDDKNKDSFVPIIIESFAIDDDKNQPKLKEIKKDEIIKPIEEKGLVNKTPSTTELKTSEANTIPKPIPPKMETINLTNFKTTPVATTPSKIPTIVDAPKVEKTELPKAAETTTPVVKPTATTPSKIPTIVDAPKVEKTELPKVQSTLTTENREDSVQISPLPKKEKPNIFELPAVNTNEKINSAINANESQEKEKKPFITEMKVPSVKPEEIKSEVTPKITKQEETTKTTSTEKKPFITEMKVPSAKPEEVKSEVTPNVTQQEEPAKTTSTEKKPFITEMKITSAKPVEATSKITKEDKIQPISTEMKKTTPKSEEKQEVNKEVSKKDEKEKTTSAEKKPFITEMKKTASVATKKEEKDTTPKTEVPNNTEPKKTFSFSVEPKEKDKQIKPNNSNADEKMVGIKENTKKDNSEIEKDKIEKIKESTTTNEEKKQITKSENIQTKKEQSTETKDSKTSDKTNTNIPKDSKGKTNTTEVLDLDIDGELLTLGED